MQDFIAALVETAELVQRSKESLYASQPLSKIKTTLDENIAALKLNCTYQRNTLRILFAPTGDLQETALDNGWADAYMRLSTVVDHYTDPKYN